MTAYALIWRSHAFRHYQPSWYLFSCLLILIHSLENVDHRHSLLSLLLHPPPMRDTPLRHFAASTEFLGVRQKRLPEREALLIRNL